MKKYSLIIFILGLVAALTYAVRESTPSLEKANQGRAERSFESIKTSVTSTAAILLGADNVSPVPATPQKIFEAANDLSRKAILSKTESEELHAHLASKPNIDAAVSNLQTFGKKELAQDQKERMAAGLFLLNALQAKTNPANEYIREQIAGLILDPALEKIGELNLKRSVVADRVELFIYLKRHYPEDGGRLDEKASSELQKKMVMFVTSYLNLDKKGS